ncbi:stage V sporulation protein AD [Scatolibacter rhodanostii]|uniref:stage V sporulation protein AD n=1 Tax=Scatolibacter rhodanostii TaxID=2014781 RepID=UPI000C068FF4|nr:stage V sporulation protein AD [Scatolibacter rhodanostii]
MKRIGRYTLELETKPRILASAALGGKKESEGPLRQDFDQTFSDTMMGTSSWEQAEAIMQKEALGLAIAKAGITAEDVDLVFAGDLLNQCISSTFGLRDFNIPFLGQYGACSTMAQTLLMSSLMVESGAARIAAAVTSSHFCSAERQFRLPLEYGGQRTPTAQWTATASGSAIVTNRGEIQIEHVMPGKIVDLGIKDAANMGAAMAPAAANSYADYFKDTGTSPQDYDAIFTGDLGKVGSSLLEKLLLEEGINIAGKHKDCGLMIYDLEGQDVHAGASGCGCSASVLCGHILKNMRDKSGKYKNILFAATGALMSPTSTQQGESIPGIAHIVHLRTCQDLT